MTGTMKIGDAFSALRKYWWLIALSSILGVGSSLLYLSKSRPVYSATAIIGPRQSFLPIQRGANLGVGGLLSSLQGGPDNMDLARADIFWQSDRLAANLAKSDDIVRQLFPGRWDSQNNRWHRPASASTLLYDIVGIKRPDRPTTGEVQDFVARSLSTDTKLQTFRTLRYQALSAKEAEEILSKIISTTNDDFRTDDISEINRLIDYSYERIGTSQIQRESENLATLIQDLERQRVQMESSQNYLFEVIQAPTAEPIPVSPKPQLAIAVGLLIPPAIVMAILLLWPSAVARLKQKTSALDNSSAH